MKKLLAMKAVYSYYFPEIRAIVDQVNADYPHEMFLTSSPVSLDDYHLPVIKKLLSFYKPSVPALKGFEWQYPTAGSAEGIREYLTWLAAQGVKRIYALADDYEGYRETARTRGIVTVEVDLEKERPDKLKPGYWFISNPSARDGGVIPDQTILEICEAGHKVFYDLTYVGATKAHRFNVDHPNVRAAVISLSKPFGLFRYRVGFAFCRDEIPSLYANKWFKSVPALMIAEQVFDTMKLGDLYGKYRPWQERIIADLNRDFGLGLRASESLLLAYLPVKDATDLTAEQKKLIEPYRRGDNYRLCLTPYFERMEQDRE